MDNAPVFRQVDGQMIPCINVKMHRPLTPTNPLQNPDSLLKVTFNAAYVRWRASEDDEQYNEGVTRNTLGLALMLTAKKCGALLDKYVEGDGQTSLMMTGRSGGWLGVQHLPDEWTDELNNSWYNFVEYVRMVLRRYTDIMGLVILTHEVGAIMQAYWSGRHLPFNLDSALNDYIKDIELP